MFYAGELCMAPHSPPRPYGPSAPVRLRKPARRGAPITTKCYELCMATHTRVATLLRLLFACTSVSLKAVACYLLSVTC